MAFCIYCGSKLGENDRFCGACGKKVVTAEPVAAAPAVEETATVIIPAAPVVEQPAAMPAFTTPVVEEPAAEPVFAAPVVEEPAAEPVFTAPVVEEPAAEPVFAAPVVEEPAAEPVFTAPVVEEPAAEPVFAAPVVEEPAAEPVFTAPVVEAPIPEAFGTEPLYAAPITREHVRSAATPASAQPMPFGNKSARGSSADYSYATPERVANPVKNPRVRPRRKFLAVFFSVILCILLLISMLPTYLLVTIRNSLTQETFLALMQRVDLDQLPASIIDDTDKSLRGLTFAEALCDELNEELGDTVPEWTDLTPKDLDKFLDETAFLPFIAEHAEGILKAILNSEDSYRVPTKQIVGLLEHDINYLAEMLEIPMEDVDFQELSDELVEELELDDLPLPASEDIPEEAQLGLDIVNHLLSIYAIAAAGLTLLLLVLLLFAANHRDPMYAVRDVGIVSVLGTILPLLLTMGARGAISVFAGQEAEMYLASVVLSCVLDSSFVVVASVFVLGVVLLIVNGIVRAVQKKKA